MASFAAKEPAPHWPDARRAPIMADETDAFPAEEEADSELESQEPAAKRKKSAPFMKKVDGIQSRLDAKVKKLSSTEALIDKMQDKQRNLALTKKEQSSLERWRSTSASLVTEVNTLRTELKEAQEEANAKKAAAEAAAAAAAEKKELEAEMKREYSEAGTIAVINEKCKRDRNFDSNADNHDLVWQHVGEAVNKLTETGQLPASDRRNYKSHRAKYAAHAPVTLPSIATLFHPTSHLTDHISSRVTFPAQVSAGVQVLQDVGGQGPARGGAVGR